MEPWYWIGILLCLTQSAMFSGLNLAFFSVSRLRLEVDAAQGDRNSVRVLAIRKDPNLLLATILWGNVAMNCLLTLLADSVLAGVSAFILSTVAITFFGEIFPQAYFSRHALRVGAALVPVMRFYQLALYPVTKPTAWLLDHLVGPEAIVLWRERSMRELIRHHMRDKDSDVSAVEGAGAINFLDLDDIPVA
jgi:metal transporter CNNM